MCDIGYKPGTFDLFHVGHLRSLISAKALCDKLIVGVLADDAVEAYKGKKPSIPFQQRVEIVGAMGCVDAAIEAHTRNVWEEWQRIKFDVVFIGDDWYGDTEWIEWEHKLKDCGVVIRYLPRNCYISTTDICNDIKGAK